MTKKIVTTFFCLILPYGFGTELPNLKEMNISISEHIPYSKIHIEEPVLNSSILIPASKNDLHGRAVYPIEDSNFKEVFRNNP